jgi:hypothetical protein
MFIYIDSTNPNPPHPPLLHQAQPSSPSSSVASLPRRLDLSTNSFVGPLPDALADLPGLLYLNLQGNNFSGPIPSSFARFPRL